MRSRAIAPLLRPWRRQSLCRPEPLCGSRISVISSPGFDWEGARSTRDRLRQILAFDLAAEETLMDRPHLDVGVLAGAVGADDIGHSHIIASVASMLPA